MKKILKKYGGIVFFYVTVALCAFVLTSDINIYEKPADNSLDIAYTTREAN